MRKITLHSADFAGMNFEEVEAYIAGMLRHYSPEGRWKAVEQIRKEAELLLDQEAASAILLALVKSKDITGSEAVEICTAISKEGGPVSEAAAALRDEVASSYHLSATIIAGVSFGLSLCLSFFAFRSDVSSRFVFWSFVCSLFAFFSAFGNYRLANNKFDKVTLFFAIASFPLMGIGLLVVLFSRL